MVAPIQIGGGINIGGGISIGESSGGGGGTAGIDGAVGYDQMPGPIIPNQQIEDPSATVNDPVGFTINDDTKTGVAAQNLTVSNQTWFANGYGTGFKTVYWGPGSTVASSTVNLVQNNGGLVFYIQGQVGPATYNYPFTFVI